MQGKALPGFRDFYPDDLALRNHIFSVWRSVARRYGFEEYDGPPLEALELYTQKSGDEIVGQLYSFTDKGDRQVALRPEMTPTLARMVGARAQALKKPIRWFAMPQLFRYERQQRGRLREHFQLNCDIIGEAGPLADAELIAAAIDILRAFGMGAGDVSIRVSDRRVLQALLAQAGLKADQLDAAYWAIDRIDKMPRPVLEQELLTKLGSPKDASVAKRVFEITEIRDEAALRARKIEDAAVPLLECISALRAMGLGDFIVIDFSIVRGLAYYDGIVFEMFDAQKSLRAICGGGRYDGLLKSLGGVDLPALGFGMGDVVLGELLKERGKLPTAAPQLDAFLIAVSGEDVAPVLTLAHQLRDRGLAIEFGLRQANIRKQMELAVAHGARRAVIIGPSERQAGEAVIRHLDGGTEERVPLATLATALGARG